MGSIISGGNFRVRGPCSGGQLYSGPIIREAIDQGEFSLGAIILGDNCLSGNYPRGNHPGGNYSVGNYRGSNFPQGQLS